MCIFLCKALYVTLTLDRPTRVGSKVRASSRRILQRYSVLWRIRTYSNIFYFSIRSVRGHQ